MKEKDVFIKINNSFNTKFLIKKIKKETENGKKILQELNQLQTKEKTLIEEWGKRINLARLSLNETEENLPKGNL